MKDQDRPQPQIVALESGRNLTAEERSAETALLVRVRDTGDRVAYREFFDRLAPRLMAYAQRQISDADVAQSVVQDVMVAAWTHASTFNPEKASARTWIYTLVRNRLIDVHRADTRRKRAYDNYQVSVNAAPDDQNIAEQSALGSHAIALLDKLPPEQAQALVHIYIEGRSHREVAETLDIPTGTVKSRTRLALIRLRELMELES